MNVSHTVAAVGFCGRRSGAACLVIGFVMATAPAFCEPQLPATGPAASLRTATSATGPAKWLTPVARGSWSFELFSPPEIFFDESAAGYVRADRKSPEPAAGDRNLAVRLAGLRPEALPIRLIGHLGATADKRAVFEDRDSGAIFVARPGPLPGGKIELQELVTDDATVGAGITAVVRVAGMERTLALGEGLPGETGRWRARLEFPDGQSEELGAGETIEHGGIFYDVVTIDPAELRVRLECRQPGQAVPEFRWIEIAPPDEELTSSSEEAP